MKTKTTKPARICKTCRVWNYKSMDLDCDGNKMRKPTIGYCSINQHCTSPGFTCAAWQEIQPRKI